MTLGQIKQTLLSNGEAKRNVQFTDNQGGRLSLQSKLRHVLELNSFNMNIDDNALYHCYSSEGLSEQVTKMTPRENANYEKFKAYKIDDMRARNFAKLVANLQDAVESAPNDKRWNEGEISQLIKNSILKQGLQLNSHRD